MNQYRIEEKEGYPIFLPFRDSHAGQLGVYPSKMFERSLNSCSMLLPIIFYMVYHLYQHRGQHL